MPVDNSVANIVYEVWIPHLPQPTSACGLPVDSKSAKNRPKFDKNKTIINHNTTGCQRRSEAENKLSTTERKPQKKYPQYQQVIHSYAQGQLTKPTEVGERRFGKKRKKSAAGGEKQRFAAKEKRMASNHPRRSWLFSSGFAAINPRPVRHRH